MDSVKVHYIWHLLWIYGYSESFVYLCWVCLPFLFPFYWNKKRWNFLRVGSWLTRLTLQQTEATHWSTKAWLAPLLLLLLSTLSILCNFTFLQSPVREILASFFVHLIHLFNFVFFWNWRFRRVQVFHIKLIPFYLSSHFTEFRLLFELHRIIGLFKLLGGWSRLI